MNLKMLEAAGMDASSTENNKVAHLRWFIMSDNLRGKGAGNDLMALAMFFCNVAAFEKVYLWTFQGLAPARYIYEKFGFKLVEEFPGEQWGKTFINQRFELLTSTMAK